MFISQQLLQLPFCHKVNGEAGRKSEVVVTRGPCLTMATGAAGTAIAKQHTYIIFLTSDNIAE